MLRSRTFISLERNAATFLSSIITLGPGSAIEPDPVLAGIEFKYPDVVAAGRHAS
jgi:hypothetical protein